MSNPYDASQRPTELQIRESVRRQQDARISKLEARVAELRNELATAQDGEVYFERLYEEVKTARNRLLVALEQVEWVAGGGDCGPVCAWCDASQPYHAPNCDRQAAIGRAKGEAR